MTDTRKKIIELISDYMDKTLSFGCYILNDVNIEEQVIINDWNNFKEYGIITTTGNINGYRYDEEKAEFNKIIGHYDITAVLKYIKSKHSYGQGAYHNTTIQDKGNILNVGGWFTFDNAKEFHSWNIQNKPLHIYTEQEEKDLLELLLKLK